MVEGMMVNYILEDLGGGHVRLDCSVKLDDGWCQTKSSSSRKFQIDFSLIHTALNNDDKFPVQMRFSKMTRDLVH